MNEKEKAIELVEKFQSISGQIRFSKEYALIAVDEIIESVPLSPHNGEYYETLGDRTDEVNTYWLNVKSEIQKL